MKRYVIEFGNDMTKRIKNNIAPVFPSTGKYQIEQIEKYITAYKRGLITDIETVQSIINVIDIDTIHELETAPERGLMV